jgi:hypothetical protein
MERNQHTFEEYTVLHEANQVQHFRDADPRCRAMQLPEGVLLRYTLSQALYFYLRSGVNDGNITTRVYASDSPYDRKKADIGEVRTPMFAPQADQTHLFNIERLLRAWIDFVKDTRDQEQSFKSFEVGERRD